MQATDGQQQHGNCSMTNTTLSRIQRILTDSGLFNAGQQEERRRIQYLIDARIDELSHAGRYGSSRCLELLQLRKAIEP